MRAMFGLVSLLVVLFIILMVFKYFEAPTIEKGEKAKDEARQISGRGDDGKAAIDSFKTEGKMKGGTLEGLMVTEVTPGGALEAYGLRKGDEIVSVNGTDLAAISSDPDTAKAMAIQNGFQGGNPIIVVRDGKRITLPDKGTPGTTGTPSSDPRKNVQDQLKGLGIQSH